MADDTNFRSFRPADQRWPSQGNSAGDSREGGNDPLAELARLIGQTDPFGELNKVPPRPAAPAPRANPAAPAQQPRAPQPPTPTSTDPYGAPLSFGRQQPDARGQGQQQGFQPAYDPAIYGTPQQAAGYPSEAYSDDPSLAPEADEHYEDDEYAEERPRRRGLKIFVAVAALAVIGAGGAWGYRALFKNGVSGPPPVIKANTTPSKIAAAPVSTKQINDRVGDASQEERVVSREETPVNIKDTSRPAPRMVFPGVPTAPTPDANAVTAASPPAANNPPGPAWAEPKKIRTVTIRPDQMGNAAAPTQVSRQNADSSPSAAATSPQPAPAPQRSAPAAQNNAPLSLSPQVASAEASAPRPATPPAPAPAAPARVASAPPAADAPTTASTAGRYTVQISSQRSENEAHASFRSLQAKFPSLLGDRQPIVRRADLGDRGIYFRAMVGPFASVEQATQFCGSLKSAGGQCVVQRN